MSNNTYDSEQLFSLSDGRTLAYERNGDRNSSTVVLFFHGAFSIGRCKTISPYLQSQGVHYIAPTLQGWGESSPIPTNKHYAKQFAEDINELLVHFHKNDPNLKLYVAGGSYGTVFAQMLYGAPYDTFPMGRYLKGCLLLAPLSPFKHDKGAFKTMTWGNYLMVSGIIPFKLIQRLAKFAMSRKLATIEGSQKFVNQIVFDKMSEGEKAEFQAWCAKVGHEPGEFEQSMALAMHKSVSKTWDGYFSITDVGASDWGFVPGALDEEHSKCKVLIIASKQDDMAPIALARYLARTYPNTQLIEVEGGHIASMYRLEDAWATLLKD